MYITIETKTEQFFLEAQGCKLEPMIPPQEGEPMSVKTKMLIIYCEDSAVRDHYALESGDWVYIMNDAGKTINKFSI